MITSLFDYYDNIIIAENFRGRNIHEIHGFEATHESEVWTCYTPLC